MAFGKTAKKTIRLLKAELKPFKKGAKLLAKVTSKAGRDFVKKTPGILKKAVAAAKRANDQAKKAQANKLSKSQIAQELRAWNGMFITVGIHSSDGAKLAEGTLSLAQIMTVHEFGSDDGTIPQRSWLRAWFDESQEQIKALIKAQGEQIAKGNLKALVAARRVGAICVGEIQRRWAKHPWKDLAESTLARNPKRAANSALTDTGQARGAVTFQVRNAAGDVLATSPAKKGA